MGLILRSAGPEDAQALDGIRRQSIGASSWEPLQYDCTVAELDGEIAGFLVTRRVAPDEFEVLNLAVHPAYRRRGMGKALLSNALEIAHGQWFLEVRESNAGAISFYRSLGFEPVGRREDYYYDPAEAAIVMRILS